MKKLTLPLVLGLGALVLITVGFLIPIDSYTTSHGCPSENMPTIRLHRVFGDNLDSVRASDQEPGSTEGCSQNAHYVLYFL